MELTDRRENGLDTRAYNYRIASVITQKNHFLFPEKNCSKLARALYQSRSNKQRLELVLSLFKNGLDNYYLIECDLRQNQHKFILINLDSFENNNPCRQRIAGVVYCEVQSY